MSMHILPTEMHKAAKVATYLARAARARFSVQDGSWLNADGERKGKMMARERLAAARAARLAA